MEEVAIIYMQCDKMTTYCVEPARLLFLFPYEEEAMGDGRVWAAKNHRSPDEYTVSRFEIAPETILISAILNQ